MNNNATQENASESPLFPSKKDEEECIFHLKENTNAEIAEEEDLLRQLNRLRYNPRDIAIQKILNYAEQVLKNEVEEPH